MDIDDKNNKIIEILKKNSRSSIRDIAKATGIKPSTVHQRITKLRKQGVIEGFITKINRKYIGENIIIYALATTEKQLDQSFLRNKHIKEATNITGEYDLILKLTFKDMK